MATKKSSPIKLTEEEVNLTVNLNQKKQQITDEINYVAQQKVVLDYRQRQIDKAYEDIVTFERQIISSLTQKYGNGTVDIEAGTFIPS